MVKRKVSDSGLLGGFVREDEARQQVSEKPEVPKPPTPQAEAKPKPAPKKKKLSKPTGPEVSVQGLSGRMITGVIKAVKKRPKPEPVVEELAKAAAEPAPVPKAEVAPPPAPEQKPVVQAPAAKVVEEKPPVVEKPAVVEKAPVVEPVPAKQAAPLAKASVPVEEKAAAPAPQREEKPVKRAPEKPKKPAVKVDQGVVTSYAERMGLKRIRPQSGNYVGKSAQEPAYANRPPRGGYRGGRPQGRPPYRTGTGGYRPSDGLGRDKDAPAAPQRTRSPRPPRPGQAPMPMDPGASKRNENRRSFAQRDRQRGQSYQGRGRRDQVPFDEASLRRSRRQRSRRADSPAAQRAQITQVKLPASMTVKELAEFLKKTGAEIIAKLIAYGVMATLNQELDYDTAEVVCNEFGIKAEQLIEVTEEEILFDESEDSEEQLQSRPPVVVVMGHVDHGKTSILDWIRQAKVAEGEAGGITQHIGAYMVDAKGKQITFLDTPGHEAFTTMRARGAKVTDIAILVVAADDGVMPQTIEAIHHAKAAETEIIVAINKIDRPGINVDRVKQELSTHGIVASDWGGEVEMVPVSALTGENMDDLLEMISLTADILELKANPKRQAKGTVIEAKLDKQRGPLATVLVQRGTLRLGETVVVGSMIGNIRAMSSDRGQAIEEAGPSVPVEILGLPEVPEDGDVFYSVANEKVARSLIERRKDEDRERLMRKSSKLSLDNLFEKLSEGDRKELNLIVKGDVQGSVEALTQSLEKLSNDEVKLQVIHGAVGAVTESDVRLADVSEAIIIGFNVRPTNPARIMANDSQVDIRMYRVIYNAIEDIEKAMKGMLAPTFEEEVLGHAEIRETYKVSGIGTIAGCYVTDGKIQRNAKLRLLRDGVVIHEGRLASLRRFTDDVREVATGYECGMSIERYNDIKVGDVFEMYHMKEIERS